MYGYILWIQSVEFSEGNDDNRLAAWKGVEGDAKGGWIRPGYPDQTMASWNLAVKATNETIAIR